MDHMKDYPTEFTKPFAVCFDFLAKANISVLEQKNSVRKKIRFTVLLVCYVTFYISLAVSFSKVFQGELGFYELANLLPVFIVATQGAMKGAVIMTNLEKARTLIVELGSLWRITGLTKNQYDRKIVMLRRLKLFNSVFYWMNIMGTWQYILVPLFETLFRQLILGEDKLLYPFLCTFPFDERQNWLIYLMTYFYESYSMLHLVYMYLGVEFLMITLCSHLATEFELLNEEMLHSRPTFDNNDCTNDAISNKGTKRDSIGDYGIINEEIKERHETDEVTRLDEDGPMIKDVIRKHQKLISLSELLNDIFNKMIFFNLLFATITICFFGFVAKIARDPPEIANNVVGVVASMIPIFNLCYYAEMLSGASSGMADSAYHNLWYEGDIRYRKIIIFIIVRSQKACSLTSMRYSRVTLNTFTTVLSTTWSYFSLAISMYESEQ